MNTAVLSQFHSSLIHSSSHIGRSKQCLQGLFKGPFIKYANWYLHPWFLSLVQLDRDLSISHVARSPQRLRFCSEPWFVDSYDASRAESSCLNQFWHNPVRDVGLPNGQPRETRAIVSLARFHESCPAVTFNLSSSFYGHKSPTNNLQNDSSGLTRIGQCLQTSFLDKYVWTVNKVSFWDPRLVMNLIYTAGKLEV